MSLSSKCVRYIIQNFHEDKRFFYRLHFTFGSDEVYFQTIIMNSPFSDSVVFDNLRYIDWFNPEFGPKTLNLSDWNRIITSESLFARKIHPQKSKTLIEELNSRILHIKQPKCFKHLVK